jgi:hypothetical protein
MENKRAAAMKTAKRNSQAVDGEVDGYHIRPVRAVQGVRHFVGAQ